MSNWNEQIKVEVLTPFINLKNGESLIIKFLNDEPRFYHDKTYNTEKVCFDVEDSNKNKLKLDLNTKHVSTMQQLKTNYPITGKTFRLTREGEKKQTRYHLVLIE